MLHIRQKYDTASPLDLAYTVVITDGWTLPLDQHPSIVQHPEVFEIVDEIIPEDAQYLKYQ